MFLYQQYACESPISQINYQVYAV